MKQPNKVKVKYHDMDNDMVDDSVDEAQIKVITSTEEGPSLIELVEYQHQQTILCCMCSAVCVNEADLDEHSNKAQSMDCLSTSRKMCSFYATAAA